MFDTNHFDQTQSKPTKRNFDFHEQHLLAKMGQFDSLASFIASQELGVCVRRVRFSRVVCDFARAGVGTSGVMRIYWQDASQVKTIPVTADMNTRQVRFACLCRLVRIVELALAAHVSRCRRVCRPL